MDGQQELGVTIMKMNEGLDTGDMLAKAKIPSAGLTGGEAEQKLAEIGGKLLVKVMRDPDNYPPEKQDLSINCYAEKITEEDRRIDFNQEPVAIYNRIRALVPSAPAIVKLNDQQIKVTDSSVSSDLPTGRPGSVHSLNAKGTGYIRVNCLNGTLDILSLIPPGKNKMSSGDFVRGRKITETDVFE
jgi:methionyl-tRNA formyltransferase